MKRNFKFIITLLAVVFSVSSVSAQLFPRNSRDNDRRFENSRYENTRYGNRYESGWNNISSKRISNRDNYERVKLNRRDRDVRQLLFSTDGPVNIYRVEVKYQNGRTEQLRVRNSRQSSRNRNSWDDEVIVNVPSIGRRSEVKEIRYWFDTGNRRPFSGRPVISVYAR